MFLETKRYSDDDNHCKQLCYLVSPLTEFVYLEDFAVSLCGIFVIILQCVKNVR